MGMMLITVISISSIFGFTLKRMMTTNKDNESLNVPFKKLIVKNHLMTVSGCIAILLTHALSFYTNLGIMANLMTIVVSVSIGMMFGYNDKLYRQLCAPCIRVTHQRLKLEKHIKHKMSTTINSWKLSMSGGSDSPRP